MLPRGLQCLQSIDLFDDNERPVAESQISALCEAIGVTRLASTKLLDRVGLSTSYAVRPLALVPDCIYSSGKSFSPEGARVCALFESYERWAAEKPYLQVHATLEELNKAQSQPPLTIINPDYPPGNTTWALGKHLITDAPVAAPASIIEFPTNAPSPFIKTTTGYAAHSSFAGALENAFLECIERHDTARLAPDTFRRINPQCLSSDAAALLEAFERERIEIHIFQINNASNAWFTAYCYGYDHWLEFPQMQCSGFGTAFTLSGAVDKAVLELGQSRAAFITGLRADVKSRVTPKYFDQDQIATQRRWLDVLRAVDRKMEPFVPNILGTLRQLLTRAVNEGIPPNPIAFPMRMANGFPAVKVLVLGLNDCY